jgi:hypothetical protein
MSDNYRMLYGDIPFMSATREPCIVCGHTTGDCTTKDSEPTHIFGVTSTAGSMNDNQKILVEKDIIEEVQLTPFTKSKVLVARAGTYVTIARAKELGII